MAEPKKILVVDDHFEMLEFLRSMLQLANPEYEVLGVPSAEEGLLELHQTPFDLLISDVRLPGMSGFELVRKARRLRAGLPVLIITGYASQQGKEEAQELGVYRYFEKPLDTDALLAAVHVLLSADVEKKRGDTAPFSRAEKGTEVRSEDSDNGVTRAKEAPQAAAATRAEATEQDSALEVQRRLQSLLTDTGAVEALLTQPDGRVLYRAGHSERAVSQLARLLTRSLVNSFELAEALQSTEPFTIQYQAGESVDVYGANIGRDFFLILLFDARARRGRIGTVWVFAQRAVKELRGLLTGEDGRRMLHRESAPQKRIVEPRRQAPTHQTPMKQAAHTKAEVKATEARMPQPKPDVESAARASETERGETEAAHDELLALLPELTERARG